VTLQEQIDDVIKNFLANTPKEQTEPLFSAIEELVENNVGQDAPGVGDKAPDFTLDTVDGGSVTLSQQLAAGPVLLSFFRGGWCPFCDLEFQAMSRAMPQLIEKGITFIAISPEKVDNELSDSFPTIARVMEKNSIRSVSVCNDVDNRVADIYKLVFNLVEGVQKVYMEFGFDLSKINNDPSWTLPVPATFVIDTDGVVRWSYVNADYTKRLDSTDILDAIEGMITPDVI
jgi:peroxiredoxin